MRILGQERVEEGKPASYVQWSIQPEEEPMQLQLKISIPSSEDPTNIPEGTRTEAFANALSTYVKIKVDVSQTLKIPGKDYSNFSGGGDVYLLGDEYVSCVVQCTDEDGEEEDKIQQISYEKMLTQLKANMMLTMTVAWHSALQNASSADLNKFVRTRKIIGYGLLVGIGKPIVLYNAEMNFKTGATTFTELACYRWTVAASAVIDAIFIQCPLYLSS